MISIIIPVYNGENSIERCLDSILNSLNKDLEIIIVNDGSTDNSEEICMRYAYNDNRISILNIPNGGVSNARNIGLAKSKGEWIAFIDADDYIDSDFLSIPEELANVDVIEKGYVIIKGTNHKTVDITSATIKYAGYNLDKYITEYVSYKTRALWNKIFKRSIASSIMFKTEVTMGEDFLFFLEIYPAISSYALSPVGKYYYCETANSATANNRKNTGKRIAGLIYNALTITNFIKKNKNTSVYTSILYNIYLPILAQYKSLLTCSQRNSIYKIKKSLLKADFSMVGRINQIKFTIRFVKDCIAQKWNRYDMP